MTETEAAIEELNRRFYQLCRLHGITPPIGEQPIAEAA